MKIYEGVPKGYQGAILSKILDQTKKSVVFILSNDDALYEVQEQLSFYVPNTPSVVLPPWDCLPYDRVSPGKDIMAKRLQALQKISLYKNEKTPFVLLTTASAYVQKVPPLSGVNQSCSILTVGDNLSRDDLITALNNQGYTRQSNVYDIGDYAVRGSLIDIYPLQSDQPVRLDFFDKELESIKTFDTITQRTLDSIDSITLGITSEVLITPDSLKLFDKNYRSLFRSSVTSFSQDPSFQGILSGQKVQGIEHFSPLFYDHMDSVADLTQNMGLVLEEDTEQAFKNRQDLIRDYYTARSRFSKDEGDTAFKAIPPHLLYLGPEDIDNILRNQDIHVLKAFVSQDDNDQKGRYLIDPALNPENLLEGLKSFKKAPPQKAHIFCVQSQGSQERLDNIAAEASLPPLEIIGTAENLKNVKPGLYKAPFPISKSFETPSTLFLSEKDLFSKVSVNRRSKKKKNRAEDFLTLTAQLELHDYIVHKDHGIGRYQGLETVKVNHIDHDCVVLVYKDNDKLFVPVEHIDVISRYGSEDSIAQLDKLGGKNWDQRKGKVRKKLREVADYLIKIAAQRSLQKGVYFEKNELYDQFIKRFPYTETQDQMHAIEDMESDLSSGTLMDRLVCGDVGFGKTEVALRAAYLAASNGYQVAVLTPTTILCRQHYHNFIQRFQETGLRVEQLSRLVSAKESNRIKEDVAKGKIDVLIGTHAMLSESLSFKKLGLLIIDEEQHFGVKQKEKIKKLRSDLHILTLTATPIPRTLQLSLTGVRSLSLITTPPVDRLAVRTFITPNDDLIIKESIERELQRGGQVFYVSPRVEELPKLEEKIKNLFPEVSYAVAHGQMPVKELETIIDQFYQGHFKILISTNIIESGIDIPTANTMIIHKSDLFGLAQLYQLRGRVGRSKLQSFAYLTYDAKQSLSDKSRKRLEVLQSLDSLGAGFKLASHDLDIRGAGNIVGEEQTGHIREVGVEFYQTLLQEAIMMARAEEAGITQTSEALEKETYSPQINLGIPILIPELYIDDLSLRLDFYKKIATLSERSDIDALAAEMIDRFGTLPKEVKNLLEVIEIKALCRQALVDKIDAGPKGMTFSFYKNQCDYGMPLLGFINQKSFLKFRHDQTVVVTADFSKTSVRLDTAKKMLKKFITFKKVTA